MMIHCEECGAINDVSADQLAAQDGLVRCKFCNDFLVIHHPVIDQPDKPLVLSRLVLKYRGLMIEHQGPGHQLTMGRQEGNDIRIQDGRVSRVHAVIDYVKGKYVLTDKSLNGTYVLIHNREGLTVKEDTVMLVNQGIIGLGCKVDTNSSDAIRFIIGGSSTIPSPKLKA